MLQYLLLVLNHFNGPKETFIFWERSEAFS